MTDMTELLPAQIDGWQTVRADQTFNSENLYDYINGGAELYLSYGFEKLLNRTYSQTGQPDIIVDVFDMSRSENAFGVFSHSREKVSSEFGQGSQYTSGLLIFWKDRYFVSILASPETEKSKTAVYHLAEQIDNAIPQKGALPPIIKLLPQTHLIPESVRYFRHQVWLNSHYFIASENILHINDSTHAVLAKYKFEKNRPILLLVKYPEIAHAQQAKADFIRNYLPELSNNHAVRIEDGTWCACYLDELLLKIVFNASTEQQANRLIEAIKSLHN